MLRINKNNNICPTLIRFMTILDDAVLLRVNCKSLYMQNVTGQRMITDYQVFYIIRQQADDSSNKYLLSKDSITSDTTLFVYKKMTRKNLNLYHTMFFTVLLLTYFETKTHSVYIRQESITLSLFFNILIRTMLFCLLII